jgi:3-oxoadipate enol-lactonase
MNAARSGVGYARISGAALYFEVAGAGDPLVLLHEGFADSGMFDDQIGVLAAHYRVIRYDRHGCGRSGAPAVPYTHHEALRALLRYLGVARAAVLGMSAGGGVAIDFTLAYPTMVEVLIPVAAAIGGYVGSQETMQKWGTIGAALAGGDVAGATELTLRMWVDGPTRAPDEIAPGVRARMRRMITHYYTIRRDDPPALDPPAISRLGEIAAPTLIVVGDRDVPDVLAQAELLKTAIGGARIATLPGVAHVPNMERPRVFNDLVLEFLGATRRQGAPGAG